MFRLCSYNFSAAARVYAKQRQVMKMFRIFCLISFLIMSGCEDKEEDALEIMAHTYDFNENITGWTPEFTDYPVNQDPLADSVYRWKAEFANSPSNDGSKALLLTCNNLSGDIFMFLKRKIDHLKPNTNYRLVYEISFSSNITAGSGITLKAGGSELEPKKIIENGYYTLNLDKGYDTDSGENLASFGDAGAATTGMITKGNTNAYYPLVVKSNSKGEIWLVVGTDSLVQGINSIYYSKINVILSVSA